MKEQDNYTIRLDEKFDHGQLIDIPAMVAECTEKWFNQTLCRVNDSVVRLGVIEGEFHWHKHDAEDEFFLVLDGTLYIDLEGETVELSPRQAYTVPRGKRHRTRAPRRTVILMVEKRGVSPTGD